MNKLMLPTVLLASFLVVGALTLIPIEPASAVHTTLQTTIGTLQSDTKARSADLDGLTEIASLTCDDDFIVYSLMVDGDGDFTTTTPDEIDYSYDAGTLFDELVFISASTTAGTSTNFDVDVLQEDGAIVSGVAGGVLSVDYDEKSDQGDETFAIGYVAFSSGTCTLT